MLNASRNSSGQQPARNFQQPARGYQQVDNRRTDLNTKKGDPSVWKQRLSQEMEKPKREDTLTNLLMKARLISQSDICEAMEIAESHGKPVDQVLTTSGILSEELRHLCAKAAHYIERGLVNEALAIEGLQVAAKKGLTFEGGLAYFGWGW